MTPEDRVRGLPIWHSPPEIQPLGGGITNRNFLVQDNRRRVVVRIGDDIPVHQIMRFNELSASRAAHAAGVSPEVLYNEAGALVIAFVEGRTLEAQDLQARPMLEQALELVMRAHRDIPKFLRGPALAFWVFHVLRDYAATLRDGKSPWAPQLPEWLAVADELEGVVSQIRPIFGHNDLLPANFLHDGDRLWLIDWDYAGFNSGLFDLGGLAANNGLTAEDEGWMLERYYQRRPDRGLWQRYRAMKAASALRETMWSMVSELHSELEFDFAAYTRSTLDTYRAALTAYRES